MTQETPNIIKEYAQDVKPVPMNTKNDPQQKANYLSNDKPDFFWLLKAKRKLTFSVKNNKTGFIILPINDIRKYKASV